MLSKYEKCAEVDTNAFHFEENAAAAAVSLKNHFYALFPHSASSEELQTSYLHTMGCKSCD